MYRRTLFLGCAMCIVAAGQSQVNNPQSGAVKAPGANPNPGSTTTPLTRLGRIEGVMLDDRYLRPLKRGYVAIKPNGAGRSLSGETDEAGRFTIDNVEPGEYTVEARRDGYLSAYWGRRGGIRMPRIFTINSGQEMRDLTFRLEPWGALEGKIRFDDGEAAFGVPVILYRKQYYRGKLSYQQSGSARTNDRGEYRIAGLQPGSYIVAAIFNKPVKPKNPDAGPNDIPETEWSYATTYYASGESLTDAIPVKLESGRELTGLDIFLRLVRAVRVKLRVTDGCTGELSSKAAVQLFKMDEFGNPVIPVNAEMDGRGGVITIRGLGPGQYLVTSSADPDVPDCVGPLRDRRVLTIAEYPLDGVQLNLISPLAARFNISVDSGYQSDLNSFAFHLEPKSGLPTGTISLDRPRNSFYQYAALIDSKEEYDLILDRKAPDAYLKGPLSLKDSARIVIGTKGASLTGSVINDKREAIPGATVTLIPDPAKDRFQRYVEGYSNELGLFGIRGITPGKYLAVPWLDVPPCDVFNWDNLEACRSFGASVDLSESESKGLELVLKPNN